jgi:hypothetical protein
MIPRSEPSTKPGQLHDCYAVTPLGALLRFLVNIAAIVGWIVLWAATMAGGLEIGKTLAGPNGHEGYVALTGISGLLTFGQDAPEAEESERAQPGQAG